MPSSREIDVNLPELYGGSRSQQEALLLPGRRKAIRCGRRWGKSTLAEVIACEAVLNGQSVGYFTPGYKYQSEIFNDISSYLDPVKQASSKIEGVFRTITGGRIDFWSLEDPRAGRSRKYHVVIIDEAAFTKPNMMEVWEQSIEPTLLDYSGVCWALSNTNGQDPTNFFWLVCTQEKYGFKEFYGTSEDNPNIPERLLGETEMEWRARKEGEFAALRAKKAPLVFDQEYLAKFVDFSGEAFFALDKMLVNGEGIPYPPRCDYVFAVMDTALKDNIEHDGTGIAYYAYNQLTPVRVVLLDWDAIQIEGATLEEYMQVVFDRMAQLNKKCGARNPQASAVFIEDKNSGTVLLQHGANRGWPVEALPSDLTAVGKQGRALAVSGHHYCELMKMSQFAYDKITLYKEVEANHYRTQVCGFRIGAKPGAQDDLADCHMYALAITCGYGDGF